MDDILELKQKILTIIQIEDYDLTDLANLIDPMETFIGNELFMSNIKQMVNVIIKDRNGDNKFNMQDMELMSKDVFAITALVKGILLILNIIPQLKLQYDAGATEELIFKILMYIFLVVVPKEAELNWTFEEKEQIADLVILVYDMIKSSQIAKDLVANIIKWIKESQVYKYICHRVFNREDMVQEHLPGVKVELRAAILRNKEIILMNERIFELEKKFGDIEIIDDDTE